MRIEPDMLILVADGRKLLLLQNAGNAGSPELVVAHGEEQSNPPDREQKSDAQGQRPGSIGPGQSSAGETDYHQQAEDRFAVHAAELLNRRALANGFDKLVVIAAPTTLGTLRRHYHAEVKSRLVAEIAKDMTGHSIAAITRSLMDVEPATT